jgi:hypothetical protein
VSFADFAKGYVVGPAGRVRRFIEANVALLAATMLVLFLLFRVDQVSHILWAQRPRLGGSPYQWLLFIYVILLAAFNITSFLHISRWFHEPTSGLLAAWHWVTDWPLRLADRQRSHFTLIVGIVLAATGLSVLIWGASGQSSRVYALSGLACQNSGVLLLATGAWFLIRSVVEQQGPGLATAGRIVGWLVVSGAFGEAIWILGGPGGATWGSYRLYTIWAIIQLLTLLMLVSRWVDIVHASTMFPIRLAAIAVVIAGLYFWMGHDSVRQNDYAYDAPATPAPPVNVAAGQVAPPAVISDADRALANAWFSQFQSRLKRLEGKGPAVFVAAAGGGSRAATYAALTYDALARTPVPGAQERTVADNIVLISSVSGGSLASAYFVQSRAAGGNRDKDGRPLDRSDLRYSIKAEIQDYLKSHPWEDDFVAASPSVARQDNQIASPWPNASTPDFNAKMKDLQTERKDLVTHFQDPMSKVGVNPQDLQEKARRLVDLELFLSPPEGKLGGPAGIAGSPDDPWPLRSAAFDDMCTDFMAPVLRGTLSLTFDRGDALARFWTQHYQWASSTNTGGYARDGGASFQPTDPLVLFNATDVAHGSRLVAGFPALPPFLWKVVYDPNSGAPRSAFRRGRPRSISETNPGLTLSLSRAVRLSSNFPFGFRISELPGPAKTEPEAGATDPPTHVTDGGVVDNSGLDSVAELLVGLGYLASDKNQNAYKEFQAPAKDLLESLRKLGVLMIEIDTGAKPSSSDRSASASGVLEPLRAMTNAGFTEAELARKHYIDEIRSSIEHRDGQTLKVPPFRSYTFVCVRSDDSAVMTAWALGSDDKGNVIRSFLLDDKLWNLRWHDLYVELTHPGDKAIVSQEALDTAADRKRVMEERARSIRKK